MNDNGVMKGFDRDSAIRAQVGMVSEIIGSNRFFTNDSTARWGFHATEDNFNPDVIITRKDGSRVVRAGAIYFLNSGGATPTLTPKGLLTEDYNLTMGRVVGGSADAGLATILLGGTVLIDRLSGCDEYTDYLDILAAKFWTIRGEWSDLDGVPFNPDVPMSGVTHTPGASII